MTVSNSNPALNQFLSTLIKAMKVEKACFLEFDEHQSLLTGRAYAGIEEVKLVSRLGEGMVGWVAEQSTCMVINDIQHTPELSDELTEVLAESSFLATPLHSEGKLLGVIVLASKKDSSPFDFKDRQHLVTLTPLAACAIQQFLLNQPDMVLVNQFNNQIRLLNSEKEELANYIRCLTQVVNCALLVVDTEGKITHVNSTGEKIFNWEASELEGESLAYILGPAIQQKILASTQESAESSEEVEFENQNGKPVQAQLSCCPYYDSNQQKQGFLVALHKQKEAQISANEQERLTSIRELTAGIAHEIRNPLAGIMTTAETLKENLEQDDSRREYLERIINEINRMSQFLTKFFAFARPQRPQKQSNSIAAIIDRIIDLEAQKILRQNISVIKDYDPSIPSVRLDANQIQQVFLNLIINSLQAMPNGGELKISIGYNKQNAQYQKYICVTISDTGVGIKPQDLSKIFTPFYTTKPKGVGLGLSLSQQILKEHRGKVGVESTPGEGTIFSISLPIDNSPD
jgi:two-component system NtrC family sensor kinase